MGEDQQSAHGLCFSSFNCSVNHCNKLFTAPNSLGPVGSKAKKCLEMSFLGPEEEGKRFGEHQAVVGEELEEKAGSCGKPWEAMGSVWVRKPRKGW